MEYVHIKFGKGKVTIAFKPESGSISIKMGFCSPEEKHFCKAKGREEATKKEKPVLVVNYDSNLCSARRFVYHASIIIANDPNLNENVYTIPFPQGFQIEDKVTGKTYIADSNNK